MTAGPINRALLESFFQNPGEIYDDAKTEGAMGVIADQADDNWAYIASLVAAGSLTPYSFGTFRQAIINGNMDIWQRGTSFVSAGSLRYTADRWGFYRDGFASGGTVTRQSTSVAGSKYFLRMRRDTANTSEATMQLVQSIDSADSIKYRGQNIALTFQVRAGDTFSAANSRLNYIVVSGTGTDETPVNDLTGAVTIISGSVVVSNAFQTFNIVSTIAVPTDSNQLVLKIRYTPIGTAGSEDWIDIRQVQISSGTIAIPFQHKSVNDELTDCQRYYEKSYAQGTTPGTNTTAGQFYTATNDNTTAGTLDYAVRYQTTKRATPTVTLYGTAGTVNTINDGTSDRAIGGGSGVVFSGDTGFSINATLTGPTGATRRFHYTAEAEIGV